MTGTWRRTLIVGFVLVATHAATAVYYANRYSRGVIQTPSRAMTLELTPNEWATAAYNADSTAYLKVAQNIVAGKGVIWHSPASPPGQTEPFIFWGPGAPVVLAWWQKLIGGQTMFTFFMFAALAQFIAGALAVATAAQWTRSTIALSLVAFGSGFCPPLQEWFYGVHLTSSEIVALPQLALMFFVLSKAMSGWAAEGIDERRLPSAASRHGALWQRLWPRGLGREVCLLFALLGVLIGGTSLTRDCIRAFAWFLAVFLVVRAAAVDRRRLRAAITVAIVLLAGEYAARYPVQLWNKYRSQRSTICQSSDGCIWRYGIWAKHDEYTWYESAGIGFGDYLDREAGQRVRDHFENNLPFKSWYSFTQLAQAVLKRPVDAVMFKAARLPVLWLDSDMWPRSIIRLQSFWCVATYAVFAVFMAVQFRKKRAIPEILYLYMLLIVCASPVMHFEFRYTFPIWNTLILVPGLLAATLSRNGWQWRGWHPRTGQLARSNFTVSRAELLTA